jgi:hypothetical protein
VNILRILLAAVLTFASAHAVAQRHPVPIINYENVQITTAAGQLTTEQVKQAILTAAGSKQWVVTEQGPGRMTATLHVRGKHTVVTEIIHSNDKFSLLYKDSTNMKYGPGPDGKGVIHPFYNRWVQDLKEAIRTLLISA